jgi:hypothetical protein
MTLDLLAVPQEPLIKPTISFAKLAPYVEHTEYWVSHIMVHFSIAEEVNKLINRNQRFTSW